MSRVSPKESSPDDAPVRKGGSTYVARRDYGTRNSELNKQPMQFGRVKATLYRRSDVENSSWFFRIHLKEEGRHFRKSLQTKDLLEAKTRAQSEIIDLLARVKSGERILALSLRDLVRRFASWQEELVRTGQLSPRTLAVQSYRIGLGCQFLKSLNKKYPAGIDTKISTIDGSDFNDYLPWRLEQVSKRNAKGRTIRRDVVRDELLVIRKMFHFAKKELLCGEKSIPKWEFQVESEGPKRRRINAANHKDFIHTTLAWAKEKAGSRDAYLRRLVVNVVGLVSVSGMRSGEVFGLRNRDVEVRGDSECLVSIRAATSKVRKSRTITVVNRMPVLWIEKFQRHKSPDDYLFSPYDDGARSARDVFYHAYKSLRVRLREVDLDWFDLYHCRHWWITDRLLAEESISLVAQAAGTSVKEIESTYSQVLTEITTKRFSSKTVIHKRDGSYRIETKLENV